MLDGTNRYARMGVNLHAATADSIKRDGRIGARKLQYQIHDDNKIALTCA